MENKDVDRLSSAEIRELLTLESQLCRSLESNIDDDELSRLRLQLRSALRRDTPAHDEKG